MKGKRGKLVLEYFAKIILIVAGIILILIIFGIIFKDKLLPILDYISQKLSFKI